MRKNQYEEALFRCEDDRFELDMIIENGNSAIRALRPMAEQLNSMSNEAKAQWRPPTVRPPPPLLINNICLIRSSSIHRVILMPQAI